MKKKNRASIVFRIFVVGIVVTLLLIGFIVAMQPSEAGQEMMTAETIIESAVNRVAAIEST